MGWTWWKSTGRTLSALGVCGGIGLGVVGTARAEGPVLALGAGTGLAAGGGPTSAVLRVLYEGQSAAFEFTGREGWAPGADARSLGSLFFGARWRFAPVHVRVGFAHNHEVPWEALRTSPIGSFAGTAEGINHRSGIEAGFGLAVPLETPGGRVRTELDLAGQWFPDPKGPPAYLLVEWTLALGLVPTKAD